MVLNITWVETQVCRVKLKCVSKTKCNDWKFQIVYYGTYRQCKVRLSETIAWFWQKNTITGFNNSPLIIYKVSMNLIHFRIPLLYHILDIWCSKTTFRYILTNGKSVYQQKAQFGLSQRKIQYILPESRQKSWFLEHWAAQILAKYANSLSHFICRIFPAFGWGPGFPRPSIPTATLCLYSLWILTIFSLSLANSSK